MKESELTVREALQFARHDFLNELQLILMHIDLGRVPEARAKLLEATERMRNASRISSLGLPAVETWLLSFNWTYKTFSYELEAQTSVTNVSRAASDESIALFLNNLFRKLEKHCDPYVENCVEIIVSATDKDWKITLTLPVQPTPIDWDFIEKKCWTVEMYRSNEYWTFTISGH